MPKFEYRAVAAPAACIPARQLEKGADPVSATLEFTINDLAIEGWEYVRAETVTMTRRRFFGRRTECRDVLLFRREMHGMAEEAPAAAFQAMREPAPKPAPVQPRRIRSQTELEDLRERRRVRPVMAI